MENLDKMVSRRKSTGTREVVLDSDKPYGSMLPNSLAGHMHHLHQHHHNPHHHQNHHHHHHHHHPAAVVSIPVRGRIYRSFPVPSDNTAGSAGVGIGSIAVVSPPVVAAVATATATSTPAGDKNNTPTNTTNAVAPRWVTREIAALDFLLGIPLENEASIVHAGLNSRLQVDKQDHDISKFGAQSHHHHHEQHHGKHSSINAAAEAFGGTLAASKDYTAMHWWEKLTSNNTTADKARLLRERLELEEKELEKPNLVRVSGEDNQTFKTETNDLENLEFQAVKLECESPAREKVLEHNSATNQKIKLPAAETFLVAQHVAPGRRLDGREASFMKPPKIVCTMDKLHLGRSVAATSELREWEVRLAHGIGSDRKDAKGLLDGRAFFSSQQGYPFAVFSLVRYEPKKEEAARRRRKVEELGGGGFQFVIPARDWRGVSYAALMKKRPKQKPPVKTSDQSSDSFDDDEGDSLSTSDESETYEPGFLDDPAMVQGRHRHIMVGNKVIGPIISSVIQFVDPADLKTELNKQFLARFDGWEPPKCQRRYIGGHVVNGVYTLADPTEIDNSQSSHKYGSGEHKGSTFNSDIDSIRMPPSLTLSKIRSMKQQILMIGLKSDLEISTIALASVYFERLCLDCRVDKSNRQISFAACLLLAYKTNEPNVAVIQKPKETKKGMQQILHPFIHPARKSIGIYSSLLDNLTNHFSLSLKYLMAAEWGVFVALGFKLHAKPSQVAFHFKRIMKVLERNALNYLGEEMYNSWQECLLEESRREELHLERRRARLERRERKLIKLLQRQKKEAVARRRSSGGTGLSSSADTIISSSARESYDDKITGSVSRPLPSSANNNSNQEDISSLFTQTHSSASGEPSPKRLPGERPSRKIKAWANVILGATTVRPLITGKEPDGSGTVGSPSMMRKSISMPHFNQDHSLIAQGSRVSAAQSRSSLLNRNKSSFSGSIPIDILVEDDEQEPMEKTDGDSEIV